MTEAMSFTAGGFKLLKLYVMINEKAQWKLFKEQLLYDGHKLQICFHINKSSLTRSRRLDHSDDIVCGKT